MMRLVSELRRRNVFRMAALYAVASWLIMQVAEVVIALANLPNWIGPATLALLAIGFPIALVVSWFYELTPEGLALERDVDPGKSMSHIASRRIDFVVIAMLAAGLLLFAWDKWWQEAPTECTIAVLPFVNLSADKDNEYFSAGLTEELVNILAKVPDFRVFVGVDTTQFNESGKGSGKIPDELRASYFLKGSVRKSGDRLRITAQIVDAADGLQLWSNSWDRTLTDVFRIQREIAEALVSSLRVTMPASVPAAGTANPEAYDLYLRARHAMNVGTVDAMQEAVRQLVHALAMDPQFAEAWALLGVVYVNQVAYQHIDPAEGYKMARASYEQALRLDPKNPRSLVGLAGIARVSDRDFAEAERLLGVAYDAAPDNVSVLNSSGNHAASRCRLEDAKEFYRGATAARPGAIISRSNLTALLINMGEVEAAEREIETMRIVNPESRWPDLYAGHLALLRDEPELALEYFLRLDGPDRNKWLAQTYHALGREDEARAAVQRLIDESVGEVSVAVAEIYTFEGKFDDAFVWLERGLQEHDSRLAHLRCNSQLKALETDARWAELLVRLNVDS
jgi:TolB-like protein/tetratricopeptide (TPR) repeat protein